MESAGWSLCACLCIKNWLRSYGEEKNHKYNFKWLLMSNKNSLVLFENVLDQLTQDLGQHMAIGIVLSNSEPLWNFRMKLWFSSFKERTQSSSCDCLSGFQLYCRDDASARKHKMCCDAKSCRRCWWFCYGVGHSVSQQTAVVAPSVPTLLSRPRLLLSNHLFASVSPR